MAAIYVYFALVRKGRFANITASGRFYMTNHSTMALVMDMKLGKGCELRQTKEWSNSDTGHQFKATMKIVAANQEAFTVMQIHTMSTNGTQDGHFPGVPLLMLGRRKFTSAFGSPVGINAYKLKAENSFSLVLGPSPKKVFRTGGHTEGECHENLD